MRRRTFTLPRCLSSRSLCLSNGLNKAEGLAVDASVIEADASRYHSVAPDEIDWSKVEKPSRAVQEYLDALDDAGELAPPIRHRPRAFLGKKESIWSRSATLPSNVPMLFNSTVK